MPTSNPYLTGADLEKIKRVLAASGERLPQSGSPLDSEAAKYLMRMFQEGVTDERALAEALDQFIARRRGWRHGQSG